MKLEITNSAVALYINEMSLSKGDALRLFVRVGGVGSGGFSVGVMIDHPTATSYRMDREGITFFVNEDDFWYLNGMTIDYNEDTGYLDFITQSFEELHHPM